MPSLPKIFSTLILVLTLALIARTENYPARFNIFQVKEHSKIDDSVNPADYRLPKSIIPDNYDLKITNINFNNFIFNGTSTITAQVKESVKEIVLNAGNITVTVNSVIENGESVEVVETKINKTTQLFKIILEKNLTAESIIKISLSFDGELRDDMKGFYKSSYYNDDGKQRWLASTQFEPIYARHAFPCFDEPEFKAEFEIGIRVPEGYNCLSNTEFTLDETKNWCHFKKSNKMSTYLIAFVISDFEPDKKKDTRLKLWARPNAKVQAAYGQTIGAKALQIFSQLFGQDYYKIMEKMDMVAVPDFSAGAMENWGLITYRETAGLYDENHSSDAAQQRVASVIVHECTHMWFGNLVTPEWWSYLWLSEAFARYYQYIGTDMITENWKMEEQFVVEQFQTAMAIDSVGDSKPMTRQLKDATTQAQITAISDSITYNKGASIVRMMEKTFGTNAFYNALKNYIQARKFKSAKPDDLWQALQEFVDPKLDVATIMKTWTEQEGYPYITVTVESDGIKLRQNQFRLHNSSASSEHLWWVPVTVSSSSNPSESTEPIFWLSKPEGQLQRNNKKDAWLILNVQSAGFYRVNYDKNSWDRIIQLLTNGDFNQIHAINRAAIVDDLLNLARAKLVDYELVFRGIQYLKRETHYLPFKSALRGLNYLTRVTAESSGYDFLKNYIMPLIGNVYDKVTFDDKPKDDRLTILLRQELNSKACDFDDASCVSKSRNYFSDWRINKKLVPKNQRSVVYCTAIRHGTVADWEFLYKQYRDANVAAEEVIILSALGCSQDTKILYKYLKNALSGFESSYVRKQDMSRVFSAIYTTSLKNAEFMIDFADKNHQVFYEYYKKYDMIGSIITGALKSYPVKRLANKVEKIVEANNTHIAPNVASINKSLNFVKQEIDLFDKHLLPFIELRRETGRENTIGYRSL